MIIQRCCFLYLVIPSYLLKYFPKIDFSESSLPTLLSRQSDTGHSAIITWSKITDLQYGFRPAPLTSDHMIVVPITTAKTFNKSGATLAVVCDVIKALKWI